jgi:hypothetical protein
MAAVGARVVVGSSAVSLLPAETDTVSGSTIMITNGAAVIDLGGPTVTSGNGYSVAANAVVGPIQCAGNEQLYAICATSSTISILRLGA